MKTVGDESRVSLAPDVLVRELDGQSVILNLSSERYFGLDPVGTRMLTVLTTSTSFQVAFEALLAEYDVDAERLRQDLQEFVAQLLEHGLVQVGLGQAAPS